MYKNKTLKGLAISAVVALGLTGFSTLPASANYGLADKSFITLAPSDGDEWTVLANGSFTVSIGKAANLTTGTLKLLVEDVKAQVFAETSSNVVTTSPSTWTSATTSNQMVRKSSTDGTFVMAMSTSGAISGDIKLVSLAGGPFSDSAVIKVTAWNDANLNNLIETNEYASATETITFLDADDVKLNVTLNRPQVGESTLSAVVSTTPTLNHEQGAVLSTSSAGLGFDVVFNRDGFASTISYATSSWSVTDRNYTFRSANLNSVWSAEKSSLATLNGASSNSSVSSAVAGTVVFTTSGSHNVAVGDSIGYTTGSATATAATVSKVVSARSFEASVPAAVGTFSAALVTVSSYVSIYNVLTPGTYGATGKWKDVFGTKSEFATVTPVAADVLIDVAGSTSVQGLSSYKGDASGKTVLVKSGTTTLTITATVVDKDGKAVAAGRVVTVANANRSTDVRVNGKTGVDTLTTDANGKVTVTVTSTAGAATAGVDLTFTPENVSAAASGVKLDWEAQSFSLKDMSVANDAIATSRSIVAGGSYTVDLMVADQWFAAPATTDTYRVVVTGTGAVNAVVPVTAGKAAVTVADNGTSTTGYSTTLTLQKLGTSGTYAAVSTTVIDTYIRTGAVTLGADATSLYNGVTVDLSSPVAAAALVEADNRVAVVAIPDYKNKAVIAGKVANSGTGAAVPGAYVTITGPTNMLFNIGNVWKRGTITVVANGSGEFSADVYSTTAQADTVVTVTSMGNSATTKLTFTGIGVGEGTSLVITAPDTVAPASTLQVKAQLNDAYGNGVDASTAGRIKFTYEGPGIGFGTLPDKTDKTGGLSYSVLLGAGDKGTIKVTVQYDQNGDGDFVDAKDLTATKNITVGATATPVADQKLTVGTFRGFIAIYAKGYAGKKLSAKVAGRWLTVASLSEFQRVVRNTGAGRTIKVDLFIDGSLVKSETVTTR